MDRGRNWNLTTSAYNAITKGEGIRGNTPEEIIKRAYKEEKTPDGGEMTDEYIPPSIVGDYIGMNEGDSVIHLNYRQDRAIQLTQAFVEDIYPGKHRKKLNIVYCGLTRYYDTFKYFILEPMDIEKGMKNLLGEILSNNGLWQLRIAETQKFRHVTSFFNGKRIEPFPKEDRVEIKSEYDPSTFAKHPEMNASDVTEEVIKRIISKKYSLIVLNFANCDMVGHTGNYESAIKSVEVVDECVGRVVNETLSYEGIVLLTADHGNVEEMVDYKTGLPKTSHTKNPVRFIYIAKNYMKVKLRKKGKLSDISPTILFLLGIPQPVEMTSNNLII